MKKLILVVAIALVYVGCKKIQEGFLSDTVRYRDRVIFAVRGMVNTLSDRINADGSTPPIQYKMSNLRDKATGEPAPSEFFTEYDIPVFKLGEVFNPEVDTTVEMLDAKRELKKLTPFTFNEVSGQLSFNRASAYLPLGMYTFDLEVTNRWGTKFFPDFADINVVDPTVSQLCEVFYLACSGSNAQEQFTTMAVPLFDVEKVNNDGARIILKIVDKNGTPFNPAAGEIIKRGDRPNFETYAKFNPIVMTDTAMICDFEVAPFPLAPYHDGVTDWAFNHYYRIPGQYAIIDGQPSGNNANPVFQYQLKLEGTYVITVKMTDVTRLSGGTAPPPNIP